MKKQGTKAYLRNIMNGSPKPLHHYTEEAREEAKTKGFVIPGQFGGFIVTELGRAFINN